jgi:SAM-dependent methyltransferase
LGSSAPGVCSVRSRREATLEALKRGPFSSFIGDEAIVEVGPRWPDENHADANCATVLAAHILQDVDDYRNALQSWFNAVRPGGHLVVVVPHAFLYERQTALPSRWRPEQRRLYTPKKLLEEVEEALVPNSYRLDWLADDDDGYDYDVSFDVEPAQGGNILLAIRKIELPTWRLDEVDPRARVFGTEPDYAFEPPRTRAEVAATHHAYRILVLKLDHLGDFLMSMPALERLRSVFREAEITLVVGSWNVDFARALGVADHVVAFDAFPRNSTEEEPNVAATLSRFTEAVGEYDLAVDLRVDTDTRVLLRSVRAPLRAGIGTYAEFPFLDISLPVDFARNEPESAREDRLDHRAFAFQGSVTSASYRLFSSAATAERDCAIIWGPYWRLRPGRYFFEPWIELHPNALGGMIKLDIGLNRKRSTELFVTDEAKPRLSFEVELPETEFEFRIWTVDDLPSVDFSFFGGRLVRAGASSVLHQSEYASLLVELLAIRMTRTGILNEISIP